MQNVHLLAKIGADTAENERHLAEILPKIGNYPTGRVRRDRAGRFRPRGRRPRRRRGLCPGRGAGSLADS